MNNIDKSKSKRTIIQIIAAVLTNGYILGFFKGKIYTGKSKLVCVPELNCYSCPGAVGSCPIGSLQAVLGGREHSFSYYIIGMIMFFGVIFGGECKAVCPQSAITSGFYK